MPTWVRRYRSKGANRLQALNPITLEYLLLNICALTARKDLAINSDDHGTWLHLALIYRLYIPTISSQATAYPFNPNAFMARSGNRKFSRRRTSSGGLFMISWRKQVQRDTMTNSYSESYVLRCLHSICTGHCDGVRYSSSDSLTRLHDRWVGGCLMKYCHHDTTCHVMRCISWCMPIVADVTTQWTSVALKPLTRKRKDRYNGVKLCNIQSNFVKKTKIFGKTPFYRTSWHLKYVKVNSKYVNMCMILTFRCKYVNWKAVCDILFVGVTISAL